MIGLVITNIQGWNQRGITFTNAHRYGDDGRFPTPCGFDGRCANGGGAFNYSGQAASL